MKLEDEVTQINQGFFLKEFSFSKNEFTPTQSSELQFSDHVIWIDDLLITFQIKERNDLHAHSKETEISWFKKKVVGKAIEQIRDTLDYLSKYQEINIRNGRGHTFNVISENIKEIHHIALYRPNELLPTEFKNKKFHYSKTAGFIHLLSADDYEGVCRTLITIHEFSEYLRFREKICGDFEVRVNSLPEQAIIGQFLYGDYEGEPDINFVRNLASLVQEVEKFDLLSIFQNFAEHITTEIDHYKYYQILKELVKLKRDELIEFKIRFDLCVEKSRQDEFALPYRMTIPRTNCGFVFVSTPKEQREFVATGIQNYTYAHKYDQKLNKCVGVAFFFDGHGYDILWCYLEDEWKRDEEMEKRLKKKFPFREVKEEAVIRYKFNAPKRFE